MAITPGGVIGYNYMGVQTFGISAINGSAYFAGDLAAGTATFDAIVSSSATSFQQNGFYCPNGVWTYADYYMHHPGYVSAIVAGFWAQSGTGGSYSSYVGVSDGNAATPSNTNGYSGSWYSSVAPNVNTQMISTYANAGWNRVWAKLDISTVNGTHVAQVAIFKSYR